jgi:O-antigen ligase
MHGVKANWSDRLLWLSSAEASRLVLLSAGAMILALSLVLTMSRSGMAALALAVVVAGGFVMRRQPTGRRAVAIAYLLVLVVAVVGWAGADAIASRFAQSDWGDLNNRRGAWADAVDIAARFPATGTGLNTYGVATLLYQRHDLSKYYSQAHNDYLQLAAEGGLLLTIPAALCAGLLMLAVRRRFVEETSTATYWLRVGAVTGLTAIALQETVEFSLHIPGNATLFAVLCAIALHRAPAKKNSMTTRI